MLGVPGVILVKKSQIFELPEVDFTNKKKTTSMEVFFIKFFTFQDFSDMSTKRSLSHDMSLHFSLSQQTTIPTKPGKMLQLVRVEERTLSNG